MNIGVMSWTQKSDEWTAEEGWPRRRFVVSRPWLSRMARFSVTLASRLWRIARHRSFATYTPFLSFDSIVPVVVEVAPAPPLERGVVAEL